MTDRLAPYFASSVGGTNRDLSLVPVHGEGRDRLEYDFAGVFVGSAEYAEGPTGATVISVPKGARTAVDARGGAVGQIGSYPFNHAICLAGGSVYGLAAATGVSHALLEEGAGRASFADLKLVSGAIIYDLAVRDNAIYPDAQLGRAALENAEPAVRIGRVGAGATASAGKIDYARTEFTGQGAAFRQVGDVKVLVVTVVNPVGVIVDRDGTIVRGDYDAETRDAPPPERALRGCDHRGTPARHDRGKHHRHGSRHERRSRRRRTESTGEAGAQFDAPRHPTVPYVPRR